MKKLATAILAVGLLTAVQAIDTIYKGDSKDAKDVICYHQGGKFFADAARKNCLYYHPGHMVVKPPKTSAKNAVYRIMTGRIYKGTSLKPEDCIATIVETKTLKGNTVTAKIYQGFAVARDKVEKRGKGITEVTSYKVGRTAAKVDDIPVLFTVADGKIYKGDSTKPEDCILTFTGSFGSARVLFMAVELPELKK
ncbi:MAG: hypothetical protein J5806_12550 [Lentisphaeria bacterium]|nr:hypothetical protein [Lentisphaeria bacterium]